MRCQMCDESASRSHWNSENRLVVLEIGWRFLCRACYAIFEFYSPNGHHRSFLCAYYREETYA